MTLAAADFAFVRDVVRSLSGFVLEEGKEYLVAARLRALAKLDGDASIQGLITRLRQDDEAGPLRTRLLEAILIGETRFFRDEHPFEALRETILPALMKRAEPRRSLRIWCAAAATGQEPYSLAMVLADFPELLTWDVRLIASDLSGLMLRRTQDGVYTEAEVNRGLSEERRARWFKEHPAGAWTISPRLRERIRTEQINLLEPWLHLPRMDLILVRNVLIYFDDATKRDILSRIHVLLRPGGCLLLGTSETPPSGMGLFQQMRHGRSIYYERI